MSLFDLVVGELLATSEERTEQIGPIAGIPVFGLDALSSAAYGPEAALIPSARSPFSSPNALSATGGRQRCTISGRGKELRLRTAMGRFGKTEELVGAAILLASEAASFVTGKILVIDGGFLASGVNE
jgi:Enoyl-(Acyl carrier protein) reductase